MTLPGTTLVAHARTLFACLDEHEKLHPDEVDAILFAVEQELRSRRVTLSVLGEPQAREPRPSDVRPADALRMFNERRTR